MCGQEDRVIHGAIVVVLNADGKAADGKAFLAHNMVLFDDDQWTSELVGSHQIEGLSREDLREWGPVIIPLVPSQQTSGAHVGPFLGTE